MKRIIVLSLSVILLIVSCTKKESVKVLAKSISLDKENINLVVGETVEIKATIEPQETVDQTLIWESSKPSIASVVDGKVTAKAEGKTRILVRTKNGISKTCTVVVEKDIIAVESIILTSKTKELAIGETVQIQARVTPQDASDKTILWTSSNRNIAQVDKSGLVTAMQEGTAEITGSSSDGKVSSSLSIKVKLVEITNIVIEKEEIDVDVNGRITLQVSILPTNTSNKKVTFLSSDPDIVIVNSLGMVMGVKAGTASVTVTSVSNPSISAVCTITVIGGTRTPAELVGDWTCTGGSMLIDNKYYPERNLGEILAPSGTEEEQAEAVAKYKSKYTFKVNKDRTYTVSITIDGISTTYQGEITDEPLAADNLSGGENHYLFTTKGLPSELSHATIHYMYWNGTYVGDILKLDNGDKEIRNQYINK